MSAIVRSRSGTSTPTAAPAAGTSALRSTCPAVTGRRPVPIQRASVTARPATTPSRASRAAPLVSGRHVHLETVLPPGGRCRQRTAVSPCPRRLGRCEVPPSVELRSGETASELCVAKRITRSYP
jgi:hypothetical protein